MNIRKLVSLASFVVAGTQPLAAQNPAVSANVRLRAEAWDWFETDRADGNYAFGAALARIAIARQQARIGWRVELALPALVGLPDDAVAPAPQGQLGLGASYWAANDSATNVAGAFLKQAFLRLGSAPGQNGVALRIGRFEFVDGTEVTPANATLAALKRDRIAHRLLGNFGFSHVQRSADGAHATVARPAANFTAAVFRPTRGVFDVNGWRNLDIGVAYAALSGPAQRVPRRIDWRLFALAYSDRRAPPLVKVDNRPLAARQADTEDIDVVTVGGHLLGTFDVAPTSVDLLLWAAVQGGDWGVLDQRGHAFAIEAGVQPTGTTGLRPWLRAGISRASGDRDPGDDRHGTFFPILPTPRIYARFPFYTQMNLEDVFATLMLRPTPKLSLRADAHRLRLMEGADLWYAGGGAFEKESFGYAGRPAGGVRSLARVIDLGADVRLTERLSAAGYLAWAQGGAVVRRIYSGDRAALMYIELEWRR